MFLLMEKKKSMWADVKSWITSKCWNALSMDKWKKRSQTYIILLGVSFVLSIIAIVSVFLNYVNMKQWSTAVVLVPRDKIIEINGASYIPIKMIS